MQEIILYQELDSKIRKLEQELASSKNRKGATEMQQHLKDGQSKLLKLENIAETLSEQYQKALTLYNEFVQKLDVLAKSIDSASEEKSAELDKTLKSFEHNAVILESNIGVLAKKIESVNKEVETIMNNAKKAKHNLEIYKTNFAKEKACIEPEINKLKVELEKQKGKVDLSLFNKYKAKADGKMFPVIVPENKGRCGGCRMEISASKLSELKAKKIIECENCGRLIYLNQQ